MRIFERLPGRAYAAQMQQKRFTGVIAAMAPDREAEARTPAAGHGADGACSSIETKTQDA